MQCTADFHDQITDAGLPETAGVVDDAAALDAAVDVLDARPPAGDPPIRGFLPARESPAPRLLRRHDQLDLVEREGQEAEILEQTAPRRQGVGGRFGNPLIMGAPGIGGTQKENRECRVDQQHVFHRVTFFLAAITARLLSRILGALDAPFGAIVAKRGEVGVGAGAAADRSDGGGPSVGPTMAAAWASATPRRCANSCTDRLGASPRAHSVARRTTRRT
jgi:hypothetical protein